jgi:O-acetyl-ADP-ribose deacetylase (regulator of RNase III)
MCVQDVIKRVGLGDALAVGVDVIAPVAVIRVLFGDGLSAEIDVLGCGCRSPKVDRPVVIDFSAA